MIDLEGIYRNTEDGFTKRLFGLLSNGQRSRLACDGDKANSHSIHDIEQMQVILYDQCLLMRAQSGQDLASLDEVRKLLTGCFKDSVNKLHGLVKDGIINPAYGVHTLIDPNVYTFATIPISMSPMEATGIYTSGGLPQIIIDKKSKGILQNGITFKTIDEAFWTDEKMDELVEGALASDFERVLGFAFRDGTIYGGSLMYPCLKKDSAYTFSLDLEELITEGLLEKGCIDHWAEVDRWNTTFVPTYNPTAEDYLHPKHIYVPISGIDINTQRAALIRPRELPYWGAIMQMGWGLSDFEGWIASYYAVDILEQSIPIMAQQMSLLLYQMPLDSTIAQLGMATVEKLMKINEQNMREWSMLNPKQVNMAGNVVTIDRHFSGFEHFIDAMLTFFCAKCEMPRPLLFHTPTKGFADNTQESLLKESEMMRARQKSVEPQVNRLKDFLIAHVYGQDSEEFRERESLFLSFDKPVVATDKDKSDIAARMAATVNSLKQAGIPQDMALELTKQYFPTMRVPLDVMKACKEAYEREVKLEEETLKVQKMSAQNKTNPAAGATGKGSPAGGNSGGKAPKLHAGSGTTSKAKDTLEELSNVYKIPEEKLLAIAQAMREIDEAEDRHLERGLGQDW